MYFPQCCLGVMHTANEHAQLPKHLYVVLADEQWQLLFTFARSTICV